MLKRTTRILNAALIAALLFGAVPMALAEEAVGNDDVGYPATAAKPAASSAASVQNQPSVKSRPGVKDRLPVHNNIGVADRLKVLDKVPVKRP